MMNRPVKQKFIQSREKALKNTGGGSFKASGKLLLQMYPVKRKRILRFLTGQLLMLKLWSRSMSLRNGPDYRIQKFCDN
jgi:hypothetical protein